MLNSNSSILLCIIYCFQCSNADLEYCFDNPQKALGECVLITKCPLVYNMLKNKDEESIRHVRKFNCGFEGTIEKVCCPLEDSTIGPYIVDTESKISKDDEENKTSATSVNNELLPSKEICGKQVVNRILGGREAELGEFPWIALLEYETKEGKIFKCGGSLINSRYILTAAHCITTEENTDKLVSVRLGEHDLRTEKDCFDNTPGFEDCTDDPKNINIEEQIPHEDFNFLNGRFLNDIALLRLSKEVNYTNYIIPICLPLNKQIGLEERVNVTVVGWGITENLEKSDVKLKADLPVVPNKECSPEYEKAGVKLQEGQLCAGGNNGIDSCKGDGGNPLMLVDRQATQENFVAVGIVSFGLSCGKYPSVYTRVSHYTQWISEHMKK